MECRQGELDCEFSRNTPGDIAKLFIKLAVAASFFALNGAIAAPNSGLPHAFFGARIAPDVSRL
jgi:hypothetical protein